MLTAICALLLATATPVVYTPGAAVTASSQAGAKYAPENAVDGSDGTRWATADRPPFPQWIEVTLDEPAQVDTLFVQIPVNDLYASWKEVLITSAGAEPARFALEPGETRGEFRFSARKTATLRLSILSAHEERHYVGVDELTVAYDPERRLKAAQEKAGPLPRESLLVRGRTEHPCVNMTKADIARAEERIERYAWARHERDAILERAEEWLRESDEYWLGFLPGPGACYAYGFTGCPICGSRTGTWAAAYCSWDNPGHVKCAQGHILPGAERADDGKGYKAADGRIHYFVGQYNAWVTEQWTIHALPALSQAYALTGDERYARRGILFLDALASIYAESTAGSWDYPSDPPSGRFARPWYQVARTLVKYVDQFDLLYNSPVMEEPSLRQGMTRRENIEKYMLQDGAYYCYAHSFSGALHNGHADYMRGALAVGCLLDIPEYVRNAVESPYSIHAMLANNIDRDGRYYETALGYAIHARNLYLTFADPLFNLRSTEYPEGVNLYDDPMFASCMLLPETQVMLAGRIPNFGDNGPDTAFRPFPGRPFSSTDHRYLERFYALCSAPAKREACGKAIQWLAEGDTERLRDGAGDRNWLLWHAAAPPGPEQALPPELDYRVSGSWVAGMKGMALLRSGQQAALIRFGPSLNHGDPDDLALLYYANGREWTYDIGYGLGSTHTHVGWASSTVSHCLVTVNEKNQSSKPGSGGSLNYLADLPHVDVAQATSQLSYASEGVSTYCRTVALIDGAYLVDMFDVAGGRQHDFSFGSMGDDIEPFGVSDLKAQEGSLAEGYAWGQSILPDGDIDGRPNKPYWNPPPGNGYGFFYDVRRGSPRTDWGGAWTVTGKTPAQFRLHAVGDPAEAIFAKAPGLYPSYPEAKYLIARREGEEGLESTFIAVYDPSDAACAAFDFDYADLARCLDKNSAETKVMDSYGTILLKGTKPGDFMTCRLEMDGSRPGCLMVHCLHSPSYGNLQVEWDGQPVGEPIRLARPAIQGPSAFAVGPVDTAKGTHAVTFRAVEGEAFYLGISGLSFGETVPGGSRPVVERVERIDEHAIEVFRTGGQQDLILAGPCKAQSSSGQVRFKGDFACITLEDGAVKNVEAVGCQALRLDGKKLLSGPGAFEAVVEEVDLKDRSVTLDCDVPQGIEGLVAVFSNPAYSRTTAYHILEVQGRKLNLHAGALTLGMGRVSAVTGAHTLLSDVPHEYAKTVRRAHSTRFFDGKIMVGEHGGRTRVRTTKPGNLLEVAVEDASLFSPGEVFTYHDLAPGDCVRIAFTARSTP